MTLCKSLIPSSRSKLVDVTTKVGGAIKLILTGFSSVDKHDTSISARHLTACGVKRRLIFAIRISFHSAGMSKSSRTDGSDFGSVTQNTVHSLSFGKFFLTLDNFFRRDPSLRQIDVAFFFVNTDHNYNFISADTNQPVYGTCQIFGEDLMSIGMNMQCEVRVIFFDLTCYKNSSRELILLQDKLKN
ncbi:hypothetical protein BpHYR1_004556 [Brachionus plicatilis]|uniref:Uncharacterized protein n=1 Tax=Brachionus plicatilis TaxID=10195 RepID=A0A3M7PAR8_BRAPC|nr:hypothetical protein BpHYR1_004556 [Brachionus plicatilis]